MMGKFIDAGKLKAEIERLKNHAECSKNEWIDEGYNQNAFAEDCRISSFDKLLSFIESLQQEQPIGEEYAIEIGRNTHTLRVGSHSDIDNLIRQEKQEQPEVDLDEEVKKYFHGYWPGMETAEQCNTDMHFTPPAIMRLAEYFYKLGLNARKEGSK